MGHHRTSTEELYGGRNGEVKNFKTVLLQDFISESYNLRQNWLATFEIINPFTRPFFFTDSFSDWIYSTAMLVIYQHNQVGHELWHRGRKWC